MTRYQLGIDESGTGAWAGPFCVGGVVLPYGAQLDGVTDSKKLSDAKRRKLQPLIEDRAVHWSVEYVFPEDIVERSQSMAWQDAILRVIKNTLAALNEAGIPSGSVDAMIDGTLNSRLRERVAREVYNGIRVNFEPKADNNHLAVAAASILAKTYRNDAMNEIHEIYPEYGFKKNSGYGTEDHAYALVCHGRTQHHRPLVNKFHVIDRKD